MCKENTERTSYHSSVELEVVFNNFFFPPFPLLFLEN
uniref:Uncharacterized protein n=1 Tax=Siphoviridae sp. ctFNZ2 TaxID=2823572 RepID=A0A8S5LAP2_9CAUD|nr:MAG TPA: hypothetical protein [Siphoviridae sp. ctFNZ2]